MPMMATPLAANDTGRGDDVDALLAEMQQEEAAGTFAARTGQNSLQCSPGTASARLAEHAELLHESGWSGDRATADTGTPVATPGRVGMELPLSSLPYGRRLTVRILDTHGDRHYAGLTALEVFVAVPLSVTGAGQGRVVRYPLQRRHLTASPPDINVDGHTGDPRTLDKLVDGVAVTCDDLHMWLVPFTPTPPHVVGSRGHDRAAHVLEVCLDAPCRIAGVRVWNYNKSAEDVLRGVRLVALEIDGHGLSNAAITAGALTEHGGYDVVSLRAAPGHAGHDFGQWLDFGVQAGRSASGVDGVRYVVLPPGGVLDAPPVALVPRRLSPPAGRAAMPRQDYDVFPYPVGHTLRFVFPTTCGDPFYLGLDAVALYDAEGRRVRVPPWCVHATPASVNELEASGGAPEGAGGADVRIPANLAFMPSAADEAAAAAAGGECARRGDDAALYVAVPASASSKRAQAASSAYPASRSWLAPLPTLLPDMLLRPPNVLVFELDAPVCLSLVRLFNYSKTPARGAGSLELWLDSTLIYAGDLRPTPLPEQVAPVAAGAGGSSGAAAAGPVPRACTSILFTSDPDTVAAEAAAQRVHFCGAFEQEVALYNNARLVAAGKGAAGAAVPVANGRLPPAAAQAVGALGARPMTSLVASWGTGSPGSAAARGPRR
jgi:hypothetical protein